MKKLLILAALATAALAAAQGHGQPHHFRFAGYGAVLRPDVKAQLHVTAAQKTKIAKAEADLLAGFDKIRSGGKADPMAMVAARDKAVQKALTPAQQKRFEAMKGKPFKFAAGM